MPGGDLEAPFEQDRVDEGDVTVRVGAPAILRVDDEEEPGGEEEPGADGGAEAGEHADG